MTNDQIRTEFKTETCDREVPKLNLAFNTGVFFSLSKQVLEQHFDQAT
jgi:hypothetical protein